MNISKSLPSPLWCPTGALIGRTLSEAKGHVGQENARGSLLWRSRAENSKEWIRRCKHRITTRIQLFGRCQAIQYSRSPVKKPHPVCISHLVEGYSSSSPGGHQLIFSPIVQPFSFLLPYLLCCLCFILGWSRPREIWMKVKKTQTFFFLINFISCPWINVLCHGKHPTWSFIYGLFVGWLGTFTSWTVPFYMDMNSSAAVLSCPSVSVLWWCQIISGFPNRSLS